MPPQSEVQIGADDGLRKRLVGAGEEASNAREPGVYTWKEVAKHCTEESVWVSVEGKVLDLTNWLNSHPGGKDMLLLMAGRDATAAFQSYHPFTDKPRKIIKKFEIGTVTGETEFPQYKPDSGFYKTMSERVNAYFKENNLDPKNPVPGMMRMVPVMGIALVCFLITNNFWAGAFPMWARVLTAIVYGWAQAMPLLHVMHDSSHTAFGHNQTWWWWGGRLFMDFFAGASMTSWHHQHVVGHHIHTNVFLADPDLPAVESGDARRLVSRQTWSSLYKYQHIYLLPLYGILGIKFRVQDFTGTFFGKENGPVRVNPLGWKLWAQLWVSKFVFLAWRIVLPLCLFDISAKEYWALVMVSEWMTGWWLAFNFQVSHVSTACEYPLGDKREPGENVDDEWAMSQVRTSVDYSHGSWWAAFMSGALNYQITHHIYPGVSQYHYPAIAPIIIQTCEEFGLKYTVLPSYWSALKAHVDHLKELGQRGEAAEVHMG